MVSREERRQSSSLAEREADDQCVLVGRIGVKVNGMGGGDGGEGSPSDGDVVP